MKIFKTIIRNLLGLCIPEGDYVAAIIDVDIKRINQKHLSFVKIKFKLTNVDTGARFTHVETIIDDFDLICCSNLAWIFELFRIYCGDYYDLVGFVVDVSIEHDVVDGKKTAVLFCNDIISFPPEL